MTNRLLAVRLAATGVSALAIFGLAACNGGGTAEQPSTTQSVEASTGASSPGAASATPSASSESTGESTAKEARPGTWEVGDAGTVKFEASGGSLKLVKASAKSGWSHRVSADKADEVEVYFTRGNTKWKFEAELDRDGLEISRERKTQPADAGSYDVGDAARVKFSFDNGELKLGTVDARSGWRETKRDEKSDDIEIEFRNGEAKAEFEAGVSKNQVKLEISEKLVGPVPRS